MSGILLILGAIVFNVAGHLLLRTGMRQVAAAAPGEANLAMLWKAFESFWVPLGLFFYVASVACYLLVLAKKDLSFAYPVMNGLGYALIVGAAYFFMKEPFPPAKVVGVLVILVGILILTRASTT